MRIRSIKPEFWRSTDISTLTFEDRFLFIGLWSYVDDNGVGIDKLASIVADLFADDMMNDPRETIARVSRGLQHLSEAGRIIRYTVDNTEYLEIVNWEKHQRIDRPNKPRYPRYQADSAQIRETLASIATNVASGTGEQGNRGTEEQTSSSDSADAEIRPEIEDLFNHFNETLTAREVKPAKKNKANLNALRLLIERDGYTPEQIRWIINWTAQDNFWGKNILSPTKLREKFDQLKLNATAPKTATKQSNASAGLAAVATWETPDNLLLLEN